MRNLDPTPAVENANQNRLAQPSAYAFAVTDLKERVRAQLSGQGTNEQPVMR
jgi:hypothetical protein